MYYRFLQYTCICCDKSFLKISRINDDILYHIKYSPNNMKNSVAKNQKLLYKIYLLKNTLNKTQT